MTATRIRVLIAAGNAIVKRLPLKTTLDVQRYERAVFRDDWRVFERRERSVTLYRVIG